MNEEWLNRLLRGERAALALDLEGRCPLKTWEARMLATMLDRLAQDSAGALDLLRPARTPATGAERAVWETLAGRLRPTLAFIEAQLEGGASPGGDLRPDPAGTAE